MLNNPRDAADPFQNTKTLAWEPHLKVLIVSFAIPRSSFAKYGATLLQTTRPDPLNPRQSSLIHPREDLYRLHLLPGPNLESYLDFASLNLPPEN